MTGQELDRLATMLYGEGWRHALARALQVRRLTVQRWERGDQEIPTAVAAWLRRSLPPIKVEGRIARR